MFGAFSRQAAFVMYDAARVFGNFSVRSCEGWL
jgi:hypothetical protein